MLLILLFYEILLSCKTISVNWISSLSFKLDLESILLISSFDLSAEAYSNDFSLIGVRSDSRTVLWLLREVLKMSEYLPKENFYWLLCIKVVILLLKISVFIRNIWFFDNFFIYDKLLFPKECVRKLCY